GRGAVEQGHGGGHVVVPPLLVSHLHRPPVFDSGQLLPGLPLTVPCRLGFPSCHFRRIPLPLGLVPSLFRRPPLPHGCTPEPAEQHGQQPERIGGGQRRLPPGPLRRTLDHPSRTHTHRFTGCEPAQVRRQCSGRRIPLGRVLRHALEADQLHVP